jgi:hypothetical protein
MGVTGRGAPRGAAVGRPMTQPTATPDDGGPDDDNLYESPCVAGVDWEEQEEQEEEPEGPCVRAVAQGRRGHWRP